MKKQRIFTVCVVLLSILIITACGDWESGNYNSFEYRLLGVWETSEPYDPIFVSLTITSDSITINDDSDWFVDKKDPKHPFRDFTKNVPLKGSSEKINNNQGIIYIEEFGDLYEIPYKYDSNYDSSLHEQVYWLRFTFPSPEAEYNRQETLKKFVE